ncbi:hypothetical protein F0919_15635 [Taibaiella lutea]|uniref:Lipoprotein n=1 Tax=Taibaiella lutea TaxID=2608001 RepID=A0A5M6CGI4_9BACT|nr:hypothetical protein [Taibaiella lutea]KAA5532229.1 hypothetical protein F0919_15635 [Taibaiella lutea]
MNFKQFHFYLKLLSIICLFFQIGCAHHVNNCGVKQLIGNKTSFNVGNNDTFFFVKPILKYDTTFKHSTAQISIQVVFYDFKVQIIGSYKYEENMSFLDPELYKKTFVKLNDTLLKEDVNNEVIWDRYFSTYDSVGILKLGGQLNFIFLARPIFCNGHYCSDISLTVISIGNKDHLVSGINTQFCNDTSLIALIKKESFSKRKLLIPVMEDGCYGEHSTGKISWNELPSFKIR